MDIVIGDATYRTGRLDARRQFHVVRRLAPVLSSLSDLSGLGSESLEALEPLARAVAGMVDADADYVINKCLGVVERRQPSGGWARVMSGDKLMFEDLDMAAMLRLVWAVLEDNLSGFFADLPRGLPGAVWT